MSAIKQALNKLDISIRKLEGSVDVIEETLAGQQRDMFAAANAKAPKASNGNGHDFESGLFAKRLDRAIEKVETILKESAH